MAAVTTRRCTGEGLSGAFFARRIFPADGPSAMMSGSTDNTGGLRNARVQDRIRVFPDSGKGCRYQLDNAREDTV